MYISVIVPSVKGYVLVRSYVCSSGVLCPNIRRVLQLLTSSNYSE